MARRTLTKKQIVQEIIDLVRGEEVEALEARLMELIKAGKLTYGYYLVHGSSHWPGYLMLHERMAKANNAKNYLDYMYGLNWFHYNWWYANCIEELAKLREVVSQFDDPQTAHN